MASNTIPNDAQPTSPLIVVNLTNIIKLTNLNYLSWKLQLEAILVGHGLFKFLDGSHAPPPETLTSPTTSPNPAYLTWVRQDKLLFGALLGTLEPTIVPLVSRATTAKEAWDILAHTYARHTRGHAKLIKANLKAITKGSQTISEYVNAIRICADQLAVLDDPLKPEDLIERVLEGLVNTEFSSIVEYINNRDTLITFDELHEKLLLKEGQLLKTPTLNPLPTSLPASAHATATRPYHPSSHPPAAASHTRPSYSSKPGSPHRQPTQSDKPKGQGYKGKCQWCHTLGHSLFRCPSFQQNSLTLNPRFRPLPHIPLLKLTSLPLPLLHPLPPGCSTQALRTMLHMT